MGEERGEKLPGGERRRPKEGEGNLSTSRVAFGKRAHRGQGVRGEIQR